MIMINSCIYVIFWWNSFRVKQKIHEIHENCGPRKKTPYGNQGVCNKLEIL